MTATSLRDPRTGATLTLISRRILVAGVHGAPGIGVAVYGPGGGRQADALRPGEGRVYRFFLTPAKSFPLLQESFTIPALRCHGGGLTVRHGTPPTLDQMRLGDLTSFLPVPWPEGSVGHVDPHAAPLEERR
ncbi:MAG: hypothetical protein ABI743_00340 [bacterium]